MKTTWAYQSRIDAKWWACDWRTAAEAVIEGYAVRLMTFDELLNNTCETSRQRSNGDD